MQAVTGQNGYKYTRLAAYLGYITQAIVNNFAPLLFVTFTKDFGLTLDKLSILITVNFGIQILVDLVSVRLIDKTGYRSACITAHLLATLGLVGYGIFPFIMNPFAGLLLSSCMCAIGGGLDEVIVSPIIEAIPGDHKESDMSLLHSFYCWGQVGVVLLSTLLFFIFDISNWRYIAMIWAVVPLIDTILFIFVPIRELNEGGESMPLKKLFCSGAFIVLLLMMVCAGASELAVAQWASLFAEQGLGVTKVLGDILGPCAFAVLMGISRTIYGIKGSKIKLLPATIFCAILCFASYMLIVFSPWPVMSLVGCALSGFAVGIMWPGTYSLASEYFPAGGTAMFAILAFGGDIGCTSGPTIAGIIGDSTGSIKYGLLFAAIFPLMMCVLSITLKSFKKKLERWSE